MILHRFVEIHVYRKINFSLTFSDRWWELFRLYVEQYRLIQMLCGGMGVTDITDITDIMDVTDITNVAGVTDITDVAGVTDVRAYALYSTVDGSRQR